MAGRFVAWTRRFPSQAQGRWEWLPLPVLVALIVGCQLAGLRTPHEATGFLAGWNLLFLYLVAIWAGGLLARSFLLQGSPGYLLFCYALVLWGTAGALAASAARGDLNLLVTIHNLGLWFASLGHLAGAFLERYRGRFQGDRLEWVLLAVFGGLGTVGLVVWSVREGWTAVFFIQGRGGTLVRELLLGSAMACFAATALSLKHWRRGSALLRWYRPGLWLIVAGIGGLMVQTSAGAAASWAGRCGLYLGGAYLGLGAWDALGAARNEAPEGETARDRKRVGFVLIPILVLAATVLRLVFLQALGNGDAFLTFYPAVVLVSLAGRRWGGILAALLSVLVVDFFWIGSGAFVLPKGSDWLAIAIFLLNCLLILGCVEALHRALARAAEAEAQAKGSAIREEGAQALRCMVAELTRSNRELERFAYVASHDLQEPMRMVHAYVDLLGQRYRGRLDVQADQYIAFAMEGSVRMRTLIGELLAYSRLGEPGREPLAEVGLQDCLDQALAGLGGAIAASGASITAGPLPRVLADPVQMVQLFQNLVGNSLKFRGGKAPRVRVDARATDTEVIVSVEDTGIGIEPQSQLRIFDLFTRLHNRETDPGTGIGLAVCRRIVERHGGRIWVQSESGSGATFFFTLPRSPGGTP